MAYTEVRTLSLSDVRALCIEKDWYTCGDCEEYSNLLNSISDKRHKKGKEANVTTEDLAKWAEDIKAHSDTEHEVTSIMFELARVSNTFFSEE